MKLTSFLLRLLICGVLCAPVQGLGVQDVPDYLVQRESRLLTEIAEVLLNDEHPEGLITFEALSEEVSRRFTGRKLSDLDLLSLIRVEGCDEVSFVRRGLDLQIAFRNTYELGDFTSTYSTLISVRIRDGESIHRIAMFNTVQ